MTAAEMAAKAELIKQGNRTTPHERELASFVIELSNKVASLQYEVEKLKGKPAPPGTF